MVLEERHGELESRSAAYMAKVMGWMCVGLLTTVVAAMAVVNVPEIFMMIFGSPTRIIAIWVAQILMVIVLTRAIGKMSPAMATAMFMLYSAMTGLTMSVFVLIYDLDALILAFSVTTVVFLAMAVYGFVTKRDLTGAGRLAMFGLFGIILAGLANWLMIFMGLWIRPNPMLDFGITAIGVVVFIVLIAYDTQKIKSIYQQAIVTGYDEDSPEVRKLAIIGALHLYLDFINLFILMLRLLGGRRR